MIRGFFRLVGLLLLAGGFIFMVYDGARWVADQTLRFTRFGQFWKDVHQSSQRSVPASQAVDRLFARLSRNAALPLCFIVRRNGALEADVKTYIMPETACSHAFGKRIRFRHAVRGLRMRSGSYFN